MTIVDHDTRAWFTWLLCACLLAIVISLCPAPAQALHEAEPNDRDSEAMSVSSGTVVTGSWSYARSKETRRGTDRDTYLLSQFTYPGNYSITVTPSAADCKYWFGLANLRGPFSGAVTLNVAIGEGNRVTIRYSGGGQPEHQYVVFDKDPLNSKLLVLEPTFWNSDHQGGFQCVSGGVVRQEIPYQLSISGAAAPAKAVAALGSGGPCRPEIEPNDRDNEAMALSPPSCVDAGWSFSRSKETRRGTDRDVYKLSGFTYPGTYTFTVAPTADECKYSFGLTNFRGPFAGTTTLIVEVSDQKRVTTTYKGGGQPDYQFTVFAQDPLNNVLLFLEPTFWTSDKNGAFQCAKDGKTYVNIPYRLTVSTTAGAMTAGEKPEAPKEITLAPGASWEGELPSGTTFALNARIEWKQVAGAASLLEIRINGQPVSGGLVNKGGFFRLADGREFSYYAEAVRAWTIFYSPDFSANNTAAGGGYEVKTDPGQAYRYQWSTGLIGGPPMKVGLSHNGLVQAPVVIQFVP
jgi:hypothetical protein